MGVTRVNLDRQTIGKNVALGDTGAGGESLLTLNKGTQAASQVVLDVKGSQTIGGDLNLLGNLNITGSVDQQSVTNLEVADISITLNKGGTTAGAATGGLLVEGDAAAVVGAIKFDNGLASKFSIGDGTTQNEIADVSSTQTLSGKTLTTPSISDFTNAGHNHTNATSGGQLTDAALSAAVGVAKGGTGLTSLTANAVMLGNGTSSPTFVAPGSSGNVLTSNGSTWQSTAPASGSTTKSTTVSGTQDSSNKIFTIGNALAASSEQVYLNGQLLAPGTSNDYTLSGTTLTFTSGFTAPSATDVIRVYGAY